ncbi:hypothetical protein QE152_g14312 [Popillia japonica]|uniref:Uncharacterized protein n=1 Tax=Popillia japonica TaxID=7064 RepID=A0AAW1L969_POPJA
MTFESVRFDVRETPTIAHNAGKKKRRKCIKDIGPNIEQNSDLGRVGKTNRREQQEVEQECIKDIGPNIEQNSDLGRVGKTNRREQQEVEQDSLSAKYHPNIENVNDFEGKLHFGDVCSLQKTNQIYWNG